MIESQLKPQPNMTNAIIEESDGGTDLAIDISFVQRQQKAKLIIHRG